MNLIGISGYINSGKDTVGKIIQGLTWRTPGGEKTLYDIIDWVRDERKDSFHDNLAYQWQIKRYGDKLKEIASSLTGIPREKFEDQEFKKTNLGWEWNHIIEGDGKTIPSDNVPMTIREFLQKLGTEAIRNGLHTNTWVNALFADYKFEGCKNNGDRCETPNGDCDSTHCYPNWIITDCRFPNEAQAIKDRGGIVIRVNRYEIIDKDIYKRHESETALDLFNFDYTINNDGNIEDLIDKVKDLLTKINII